MYGCAHENDALEAYKLRMSKHSDFSIRQCGFFVDQDASYVGDAHLTLYVECTCCGYGLVEVKCPICAKNVSTLKQVAKTKQGFVYVCMIL